MKAQTELGSQMHSMVLAIRQSPPPVGVELLLRRIIRRIKMRTGGLEPQIWDYPIAEGGSSETKEGFETLIRYSPLHAVRRGTRYPATLVTTADHDDRVVPAHSFKYAATMQPAQAGEAPILIRIETRAGHGAGKPTGKIIAETTDRYAFLARALGIEGAPAR